MIYKYKIRRLSRGLCLYCGKHKLISNTQWCVFCRARSARNKNKLRMKRGEERKCIYCDNKVTKYKMCLIHRQKTAAEEKARYWLRKERGK